MLNRFLSYNCTNQANWAVQNNFFIIRAKNFRIATLACYRGFWASAATPSSPETLRGPGQMRSALNISPIIPSNREENCHNCGGPFSPLHQCESKEAEEPTSPPQPQIDSEDDKCDCSVITSDFCCKNSYCDHPDHCECKTKPCCCCKPGK